MNRKETWKLYNQGARAWSDWAEQLRQEREDLENTGNWEAPDTEGRANLTDLAKAWIKKATADFSNETLPHHLEDEADFEDYFFPGPVCFDACTFQQDANFTGAGFAEGASFQHAKFMSELRMDRASYINTLKFSCAEVAGNAHFHQLEVDGISYFEKCKFSGNTDFTMSKLEHIEFDWSIFESDTFFDSTVFEGDASFRGVQLKNWTNFGGSHFMHRSYFESTRFDGFVTFNGAQFDHEASFVGAHSSGVFDISHVKFRDVPDFVQATFAEAPNLDDVSIATRTFGRNDWSSIYPYSAFILGRNRSHPARWRALRRLATQAHDHEREHVFFAKEIEARRFSGDWPLPLRRLNFDLQPENPNHWPILATTLAPVVFWDPRMWKGFGRFWLGWIYGAISKFGTSMYRPAAAWIAVLLCCQTLYLSEVPEIKKSLEVKADNSSFAEIIWRYFDANLQAYTSNSPCTAGHGTSIVALNSEIAQETSLWRESFRVALAHGTVFGNLGGVEGSRLAYGCLFGLVRPYPDQPSFAATYLPPKVLTISRIQNIVSGLLIFLFGLAVRNLLRLK